MTILLLVSLSIVVGYVRVLVPIPGLLSLKALSYRAHFIETVVISFRTAVLNVLSSTDATVYLPSCLFSSLVILIGVAIAVVRIRVGFLCQVLGRPDELLALFLLLFGEFLLLRGDIVESIDVLGLQLNLVRHLSLLKFGAHKLI